ncbi:MAG TPA: MetQ/NlpA family ABC transporter substrate-binding protein [Cellulomonas sp.]
MKRRLSLTLLASLTVAALAACAGGGTAGGSTTGAAGASATTAAGTSTSAPVTVTIGVTDEGKDYWKIFTDLAAKQGITVKLQNFTDYQQPNPILSQGDLDLNQFQHLLFLANYNVNAKDDLVPIGATAIYQLGLYTTKGYATPADIPDGGEVAIPNDPTNQARALLVLQSAGLIKLTDGGNAFSTPVDVAPGSRVKVVPVDANQTAVQLRTLDAAIVNNNFAADANIDPTTAIYSDLKDPDAADPYINVWVARAKDADNPVYKKLVEIYHDPSVTAELLKENAGTALLSDKTPEQLQQILSGLEDLVKKNS